MAVTAHVYNSFLTELGSEGHDFGSDTLKLALLDNSHTFTGTDDVWSDISANEVSGTGYTAGGKALTSLAITTDDTNDRAYVDAADVQWTSATISGAYHAVLYNTSDSDKLIFSLNLGGAQTCTAGTFLVQWPSGGFALMTKS